MSILVIGAAGFVGGHLAKKLCGLGHRVSGIDIDGIKAKQVCNQIFRSIAAILVDNLLCKIVLGRNMSK
jgi:nucleoside-diphosphate-sugar epimerase